MLVYVRKQRVQLHSFACAYTVVPCSLSSAGKEAARHVGDPGSIPGSGRSTAEGIGYPLQCFWASLEAQLVKNLPAMWDTWVQSLGWEDPLEKGKATHSSILAWRIPWTVQCAWGCRESDTSECISLLHKLSQSCLLKSLYSLFNFFGSFDKNHFTIYVKVYFQTLDYSVICMSIQCYTVLNIISLY